VSKVYRSKGRACWTALGRDATTGTSHNKPWDAKDRIILFSTVVRLVSGFSRMCGFMLWRAAFALCCLVR